MLLITIDTSNIWASNIWLFSPICNIQIPLNILNISIILEDYN